MITRVLSVAIMSAVLTVVAGGAANGATALPLTFKTDKTTYVAGESVFFMVTTAPAARCNAYLITQNGRKYSVYDKADENGGYAVSLPLAKTTLPGEALAYVECRKGSASAMRAKLLNVTKASQRK